MTTLAIISEFNPFHNGHKYLLDKGKEELNCDYAYTFMSGDFVQRGQPSIIDKFSRAEVAIKEGFDLVIEMPNFISLQSAEFFALKSIEILNKANIDYLVFGIEGLARDVFFDKSTTIINNEKLVGEFIKTNMKKGLSFINANNIIVSKLVGKEFITSNNILALEYMRALNRLKSNIIPYPIERIRSLNSDIEIKDSKYASSTAIRENITKDIRKLLPEYSLKKLNEFRDNYPSTNMDFIYNAFRYKLLIEKKSMVSILNFEEGIDKYLANLAEKYYTLDDFLDNAATNRYTKSRIRRLIFSYLLDNNKNFNDIDINFIKILAYNKKVTTRFKKLSENLKLVINKSDSYYLRNNEEIVYENMIKSSNLYNLIIGREINYDYKHNNRAIK